MQDKITVQELHANWVIGNPHYEFYFLERYKIESLIHNNDGYSLMLEGVSNRCPVHLETPIEIRPKTPRLAELQDPSDLDAAPPVVRVTEKAYRDRIAQLSAENAKLREFIESLTDPAIGGYYGENLIKFAKLFIERLDQ